MARVRLSGPALHDMEEILGYLRQHSPAGARRTRLAIIGKIDLLATFPQIGTLLELRVDVEYRQTIAANHVIRYRYDSQYEVIVLSIRHGRRLQPAIDDLE